MPRHGLATAGDSHEKVIGPIFGFWLACYTAGQGESYYGYAKLCAERPEDVWATPKAISKLVCGPYREPERALVGVVSLARRQLARSEDITLWGE